MGGSAKKYLYRGAKYTLTELEGLPQCQTSASTIRRRIVAGTYSSIEECVETPAKAYRRAEISGKEDEAAAFLLGEFTSTKHRLSDGMDGAEFNDLMRCW